MEICPSCGAILKDLEDMELIESKTKLPPEVNKHPKQVRIDNYPILTVPSYYLFYQLSVLKMLTLKKIKYLKKMI